MIEVVGVGAGGVPSLSPETRRIVDRAAVIVGSPRLLATLPDGEQRRIEWPRPLLAGLKELLSDLAAAPAPGSASDESDAGQSGPVVVLATGDPLDSGIGTTLIGELGADQVRIHPAVGSVALARARMGWSTRQADVLSLVSTPPYAVRSLLSIGRRLLLLSADQTTPEAVAREITDAGWTAHLTVLGNLGADNESRDEFDTSTIVDAGPLPRLNVVAVQLPYDYPAASTASPHSGLAASAGTSPGLPDEQFENDGQLTKRELRACALAALRPAPRHLLWDLGAGAGSIAIEWALHDRRCTAVAVERDAERAARIERNAHANGVTSVEVRHGDIDEIIDDLPTPDAVFIGGGATTDVIDRAWSALRPGGRLVVHTVTLDTEQLVIDAMGRYGGKLRRITIERAEPLGRYLAWKPARPVVEWAVVRQVATA